MSKKWQKQKNKKKKKYKRKFGLVGGQHLG
jgi:hypothetical protein